MRSGNRKALRCIPAAKGFLPDEEIHKLEFVEEFLSPTAHSVSFPRSGCRRRRDGRHPLSVLPETG